MNTPRFEDNDPIYLWRVQSDKYDKAKNHWLLFPYKSVYDYGATDRLHHWYKIMCEIFDEKAETDTSSIAEVPEV